MRADERVLLIGFDDAEAQALAESLPIECVAHELVPRIVLRSGELLVERPRRMDLIPVTRVVFHGIFENDLEFLAALALWNGPCFPKPTAMMDCRLRLPCLVHAERHSRFRFPRSYVSPGTTFEAKGEWVAKWGNWHCGQNKERFRDRWEAREPTLVEPYLHGEAVRVVHLGDQPRQIRLGGTDWRRSVHGDGAAWMELDPELAADTEAVREGLGLDILAIDYIVAEDRRYLLEVNHIPSVTCFPELQDTYRKVVADWLARSPVVGQPS